MSSTLSSTAREILAELGIEIHEITGDVVHMGDQQDGPYQPAPIAAVEYACQMADATAGDTADRFAAWHDALREAAIERTYTLRSTKHTEEYVGALAEAVGRARQIDEEYQPAYGVAVENHRGEQVAEVGA